MRTSKILYAIGAIFIILNYLAYKGNPDMQFPPSNYSDYYNLTEYLGKITGENLFFIIGGILVFIGYRKSKKA
tara:strand:- start:287 stop:505 length:219 start_codon:yes stop_codon:yes gene_type:complete